VFWVEDIKGNSKDTEIRRNLCLRLPFVEESEHDIEVRRNGEELTIDFGRLQRRISLPRILNDADFVGLNYHDGILKLGFSEVLNKKALKQVGNDVKIVADYDDPFSVN
jgi:hypothetical protein